MPNPGASRCNWSDVLQAVEDRLVQSGAVGSRDQVTWSVNEDPPQLSGPFDILLLSSKGQWISTDGGAWDLRVKKFIYVILRSLSLKDTGGNNKSWVKEQCLKHDLILNALQTDQTPNYSHFWPTNQGGDLLTIMAVTFSSDDPPLRKPDSQPWGDSVCTLEVHYMPLVSPQGP